MSLNDIIWSAYEKSIDPNVSINERNEALQVCEDFKGNPEVCIPIAVQWAQYSDAKTCFFGLHCIEHVIKTRWAKLSTDFQLALRNSVVELLRIKRSESYLAAILSKCLSHIIIRDWPQNWPNMLHELESLGEVTALKIFLEEVYLYESIPTTRRRELSQAVQNNLMPILFPQLLAVLQDVNSSNEQVSLVLSILFPISHTCSDPAILLNTLSVHLLNETNRKLVIDCIQKILNSGRKNIPAVDILFPVICKLQPTNDKDVKLMDIFSNLLYYVFSYNQGNFNEALASCNILERIIISEEYALEYTDSYFNLISLLCDCINQIHNGNENLICLLSVSINLAVRDVGRNDDLDESRNFARIRSAGQKLCMSVALSKPIMFTSKFTYEINCAHWDIATFMLQSIELNKANERVIRESVANLYKNEHSSKPSPHFIQLAFKHALPDLQTKMLTDIINGHDEQSNMSVLVSLSRDISCQNVIRTQLSQMLSRLISLQDCLAVSMMTESILLLVKSDETEVGNVLSVILQPCAIIFDNYEQSDVQAYSIALHLLTSIARSLADTSVGQSNLKQFIEPLYNISHSCANETFASKALEFLSVCAKCDSQLFVPDRRFAELIIQNQHSRFELHRSLLRQFAIPLATKGFYLYKDFVESLLLSLPVVIEEAYMSIPEDLPPEEDSERRQKLALFTRDVVELFRKVSQSDGYLEKLHYNIQSIVAVCFQSLYIFQDTVAVQRLVSVCTKFLKYFQNEMELPGLLCCLRALKVYIQSDREVLGHELTVLSSHLFDKLLNRLGIDAATELVRMQIGAIERDEVSKYYETMSSDEMSDKKRKKATEILFKNALRT